MTIDPVRLATARTVALSRGRHRGLSEGGCFMELASYVAGERWSDSPVCTCPVIAVIARVLNDGLPGGQRQELHRHLPGVIGTAGTGQDVAARREIVRSWWHGQGKPLTEGRRHEEAAKLLATAVHAARTGQYADFMRHRATARLPGGAMAAVHDLLPALIAVTEDRATGQGNDQALPGAGQGTAPSVARSVAPSLHRAEDRATPDVAPSVAPSLPAGLPGALPPREPVHSAPVAPIVGQGNAPGRMRTARPARPRRRTPARVRTPDSRRG